MHKKNSTPIVSSDLTKADPTGRNRQRLPSEPGPLLKTLERDLEQALRQTENNQNKLPSNNYLETSKLQEYKKNVSQRLSFNKQLRYCNDIQLKVGKSPFTKIRRDWHALQSPENNPTDFFKVDSGLGSSTSNTIINNNFCNLKSSGSLANTPAHNFSGSGNPSADTTQIKRGLTTPGFDQITPIKKDDSCLENRKTHDSTRSNPCF